MKQLSLMHDDIYSALRSVVDCLGGAKVVGHKLWPLMDIMAAQTKLLDCMNPGRKHKLAMDEFMAIWDWSRQENIHVLAGYFGQRFDYELRVITPEEKADKAAEQFADFRRQFIAMAPAFGLKVTE